MVFHIVSTSFLEQCVKNENFFNFSQVQPTRGDTMTEVYPTAQWNPEKDGNINEEWIRFYIFFKAKKPHEYEDCKREIILSIRRIIDNLESAGLLESFNFSFRPFPGKFLLKSGYFFGTLDVSIWIRKAGSDHEARARKIEEAKQAVREELNKKDATADFGFWHFPKKQRKYCTDDDSKLYYDLITRIYEQFCRFLFEKLDPHNSKNLNPNGFSNLKIIHHVLNSQGLSILDEAYFGVLYTLSRLKMLESLPGTSFEDAKSSLFDVLERLASYQRVEVNDLKKFSKEIEAKYLYFPLHVEVTNGEVQVSGHWEED